MKMRKKRGGSSSSSTSSRTLFFSLSFSSFLPVFSLSLYFFKRKRRREKAGERREWNEADADSAAGVMRMMRKLIRA